MTITIPLPPLIFTESEHVSSESHNVPKEDAKPWTASRCQRLLRQLQCRLVVLRKLICQVQRPSTTGMKRRHPNRDQEVHLPKRARNTYGQGQLNTRKRTPAAVVTTGTSFSSLSTPTRSIRTLGTMNIERCSPKSRQIEFATPILRRLRRHSSASQAGPTDHDVLDNNNQERLIADVQSLRRIVPENQYRILEAIFKWLGDLLRSTEPSVHIPHSKSLLGMCLRKVPAALAVIEAWDKQETEKNGVKSMWAFSQASSQASTELYAQLEAFGEKGLGWKPLRLVLRAHALLILSESVSDGILEPALVPILARLCLSHGCVEEAVKLLSSLKHSMTEPRVATSLLAETSKTQPLVVAINGLKGKRKSGILFDFLSTLVNTKRLSSHGLSSIALKHVWTESVEVLMSDDSVPSVIEFLCASLGQLGQRSKNEQKSMGHDAEEETLVNVVAGLIATASTICGIEITDEERKRRRPVVRRLLHVLESCINNKRRQRGGSHSSNFFILMLARYLALTTAGPETLAEATKQHAENECLSLIACIKGGPTQRQYRQTLLLACTISQYWGRAYGMPCHNVLSMVCTTLQGLGLPVWFHNGLKSDGAFVLAQKTKDLRDVAFAERLSTAGRTALDTCTLFSGWHWEEGIGEWALPSPKTRAAKEDDETTAGRQEEGFADADEARHGGSNGRLRRYGIGDVWDKDHDRDHVRGRCGAVCGRSTAKGVISDNARADTGVRVHAGTSLDSDSTASSEDEDNSNRTTNVSDDEEGQQNNYDTTATTITDDQDEWHDDSEDELNNHAAHDLFGKAQISGLQRGSLSKDRGNGKDYEMRGVIAVEMANVKVVKRTRMELRGAKIRVNKGQSQSQRSGDQVPSRMKCHVDGRHGPNGDWEDELGMP